MVVRKGKDFYLWQEPTMAKKNSIKLPLILVISFVVFLGVNFILAEPQILKSKITIPVKILSLVNSHTNLTL